MSSAQMNLQKDELQDSWEELYFQTNGQSSPKKDLPLETSEIYTALNIEKLLSDAQRESVNNSREASARASPKILHSPTNELAPGTQLSQIDTNQFPMTSSPFKEVDTLLQKVGKKELFLSESLRKSAEDKTPFSPISAHDEKVDPGTDWIWDWSSGPERNPAHDLGTKFRHRVQRPRRSLRHVPKLFNLENLQQLLLSHACTFMLGAAVMFMYLKKYCHWASVPVMD